ncbi:MAG: hypothetical protein QG670_2357, partial [Thermoproteota archaeon]|nr:hypothetical protein [Thermoproteota archaeon]
MAAELENILKTFELCKSQADSLLTKNYKEGKQQKEELHAKVEILISKSFPDGQERVAKFRRSLPISGRRFGFKESEKSEEMNYISYLKIIRQTLVTNEEELKPKILEVKVVDESVVPAPVEAKRDEKQEEKTETQTLEREDLVSLEKELAKISMENPTDKSKDMDSMPEERINIEERVKIPSENIVNEQIQIGNAGKQFETAVVQATVKENLVSNIDSQPNISEKNVSEEPFGVIVSKLESWSESTQNKLKDMERINLEVLEMKK